MRVKVEVGMVGVERSVKEREGRGRKGKGKKEKRRERKEKKGGIDFGKGGKEI